MCVSAGQLLLIQMYDQGARAHAKFLTCCRCEEKLGRTQYRNAGSPLPFARIARRLPTFHSRAREKILTSRRARAKNLTEIGLEISGGEVGSIFVTSSFSRRDIKNRTPSVNQTTGKEQQRERERNRRFIKREKNAI